MARLALRLLNLLAVLAAAAWLARQPSFAALATFLPLLALLLGQELAARPPKKHVADSELFQAFLAVLPSDGQFVSFLKDHDIGAPFRCSALDEMYTFLRDWGNAEHEFKIKKLEKQRSELYQQTERFSNKLSLAIFTCGDSFYSMELRDFEDRPEMLQKRDALNNMATSIYEAHLELVRLCSKLLK
ncbi:hypothetical protein [Metallibacterium scheffleri]